MRDQALQSRHTSHLGAGCKTKTMERKYKTNLKQQALFPFWFSKNPTLLVKYLFNRSFCKNVDVFSPVWTIHFAKTTL
ncbi:MAG: hypothetical protein CSA81_00880 [Acidobacteria bacterium]|nr:MAG: hypothetical protein CSA81_00880 [Acidobacteriota bacterium]